MDSDLPYACELAPLAESQVQDFLWNVRHGQGYIVLIVRGLELTSASSSQKYAVGLQLSSSELSGKDSMYMNDA